MDRQPPTRENRRYRLHLLVAAAVVVMLAAGPGCSVAPTPAFDYSTLGNVPATTPEALEIREAMEAYLSRVDRGMPTRDLFAPQNLARWLILARSGPDPIRADAWFLAGRAVEAGIDPFSDDVESVLGLADGAEAPAAPSADPLAVQFLPESAWLMGGPLLADISTALYRRAARLGHAPAAFRLGLMHLVDGAPWPESIRTAAGAGYVPALISIFLANRTNPDWDVVEPLIEAVKRAADAGSAAAAYALGRSMLLSDGWLARNAAQAARRLAQAAHRGHLRAAAALAVLYERGDGVPLDPVRAVAWWRVAAERGLIAGKFHLGRMLTTDPRVPAEPIAGREWLRQAAEEGSGEAALMLADVLIHDDHEILDDLYRQARTTPEGRFLGLLRDEIGESGDAWTTGANGAQAHRHESRLLRMIEHHLGAPETAVPAALRSFPEPPSTFVAMAERAASGWGLPRSPELAVLLLIAGRELGPLYECVRAGYGMPADSPGVRRRLHRHIVLALAEIAPDVIPLDDFRAHRVLAEHFTVQVWSRHGKPIITTPTAFPPSRWIADLALTDLQQRFIRDREALLLRAQATLGFPPLDVGRYASVLHGVDAFNPLLDGNALSPQSPPIGSHLDQAQWRRDIAAFGIAPRVVDAIANHPVPTAIRRARYARETLIRRSARGGGERTMLTVGVAGSKAATRTAAWYFADGDLPRNRPNVAYWLRAAVAEGPLPLHLRPLAQDLIGDGGRQPLTPREVGVGWFFLGTAEKRDEATTVNALYAQYGKLGFQKGLSVVQGGYEDSTRVANQVAATIVGLWRDHVARRPDVPFIVDIFGASRGAVIASAMTRLLADRIERAGSDAGPPPRLRMMLLLDPVATDSHVNGDLHEHLEGSVECIHLVQADGYDLIFPPVRFKSYGNREFDSNDEIRADPFGYGVPHRYLAGLTRYADSRRGHNAICRTLHLDALTPRLSRVGCPFGDGLYPHGEIRHATSAPGFGGESAGAHPAFDYPSLDAFVSGNRDGSIPLPRPE
jgi:TPR repeat protein